MKKVIGVILCILIGAVIWQYFQQQSSTDNIIAESIAAPDEIISDEGGLFPSDQVLADFDAEQANTIRMPNQIIATVTASTSPTLPTPAEAVYAITPASTVKWTGRRVGGETHGTLSISEGRIDLQARQITHGIIVFDMDSIMVTDRDSEGLSEEIKSDNFFDTATYPTAVFTINSVVGGSIVGVLTMKGISNTITFPGTIIIENDAIIVDAKFAFDRSLRNILGGIPIISNFIELQFTIRFTKAS